MISIVTQIGVEEVQCKASRTLQIVQFEVSLTSVDDRVDSIAGYLVCQALKMKIMKLFTARTAVTGDGVRNATSVQFKAATKESDVLCHR